MALRKPVSSAVRERETVTKYQPWVIAAAKYGSLADADAKRNGFQSGAIEILKLIKGESNFSTSAVSSAGARGGGQFMPATRQEFIRQYNVDPWSTNPDTVVKAVALFLRDRGIQRYNPGMSTYVAYIKGQDISSLARDGTVGALVTGGGDGGWIPGLPDPGDAGIPNPLEALDAAAEVAKFILEHLTDPTKMAALITKVYAYVLRMLSKAIWEYVLQPPWGWCQRATTYYFTEIMSYKPGHEKYYYTYAGLITTAFWSLGFSVLYMKNDEKPQFAKARDTIFGQGVRGAQIGAARQRLTKPKDVEKNTPDKPEESATTVEVTRVRELKATRKRAVQVNATGATDATGSEESTEGANDGSGEGREGNRRRRRPRTTAT